MMIIGGIVDNKDSLSFQWASPFFLKKSSNAFLNHQNHWGAQVTFLGEPAGFHGARDTRGNPRVSPGNSGRGRRNGFPQWQWEKSIFEMGNSSTNGDFLGFNGT